LYVLITDAGFLHEPIVWEKLNQVDNDNVFCKGNFSEYKMPTALPPMLSSAVSAISSSLANMITTQIPAEVIGQDYQASPDEIEQQLLIEERIQMELQHTAEERDMQLAIELHNQELRQSQGDAQRQRPQDKKKEDTKKKAAEEKKTSR